MPKNIKRHSPSETFFTAFKSFKSSIRLKLLFHPEKLLFHPGKLLFHATETLVSYFETE